MIVPNLLDTPKALDDAKGKMRVARILTNGGLPRQVTETPGEDLQVQIEEVQNEMLEVYPGAEFEVIRFYA